MRAIALGLALATTLAPAQNLPNLGDVDRSELSPSMERQLGERIMQDLRLDKDYLDDAPIHEYLNRIGSALVHARPESRGEAAFDFFFFGVRDASLNAFAMPGGFIGVNTGTVVAAQSESELASVLAHEIGHVSQRHIARMIGGQKQDALIPLAAVLLAVLAARSNPNVSSAAIMGGQGLAIQRQLNFSRDAEREADRVGLQILRDGGYDLGGMASFFGRLQAASKSYSDTAPAYLRTHPLTTERIADVQGRIARERYRQHADSLEFQLMRARARVLQNVSEQGLREAQSFFDVQVRQAGRATLLSARYGLALVAQRQGDVGRAQKWLDEAMKQERAKESPALAALGIELAAASGPRERAVDLADAARRLCPLSRGIANQYGDALLGARRFDEAVRFLRDEVQMYRGEASLQEKLARAYSAQGKIALQHLALAEAYALKGGLPAALDQLALARRSPDASFYDQSVIDAREREFKARRLEEMRNLDGRGGAR